MVRIGRHAQERLREARREEVADHVARGAVWGRQARADLKVERAVLDEAQARVERAAGHVAVLVPGGKGRHHQARVGRLQRRTRSSVSRTMSAVSEAAGHPARRPIPCRASEAASA